ncbi:sulfatase-like hydrolase/transferase [uncultured Cohaesibacter sp.]|uniref:sulfatase-like hydrolase/transferase n=1 Tax=uncultured Cohaesibacter sp. TaxID=1002546 RepID=UPI0029C64A78|nr:sulfatase-like hydrolase/transferase [uncultured Cohaesibacter sp.]
MTDSKNPDKDGLTTSRLMLPAVLFVVLVSFVILVLPDHPGAIRPISFMLLPIELPLMLLALVLLPRRIAIAFAALSTLFLFTLFFLKLADIAVQSAFQRRFNPYLDIKMLADGWNLLSGTVGKWMAAPVIGLTIAAFLILICLHFLAQRQMTRLGGPLRKITILTSLAFLVVGIGLWAFKPKISLIANLRAFSYLENRLELVQKSVSDLRTFERDLTSPDPLAEADNLFQAIKGRDVVLIFVESYGRSAIEDPLYSPIIQPRLTAVEAQLQKAGLAIATGWSLSPTMGGLSWLAHGTFLSGLWVDSQNRYDRLMISERKSLNRLFQQAGWRTAAIMPAITMAWPEAEYFGYDQVLAAKDLGYKGKPFNWVTMPDQYTLSAFERLARQPASEGGKPLMAEIALVSSHAPWTPVAKLIDWDDVGDGTVFNEQATSGETPREVWSDRKKVQQHYIGTIDYSLHTLGDYIARFSKDAVFIILGDHQPAPIITGDNAPRSVPVHVISKDRDLIKRFEEEGFSSGMTPDASAPETPMNEIRALLARVFSRQ